MESSQLYGGAEECHSSESGWTMYLGSSIHSDDDHNQHSYADYDVDVGGNGKNYYQDDDSDDSMASDASSGPSHQGVAPFKGQQDKLDHDDDDGKYCSQRKSNKQVGDEGRRRNYDKARKANTNNAPSESGSKVRNSLRMGKMK